MSRKFSKQSLRKQGAAAASARTVREDDFDSMHCVLKEAKRNVSPRYRPNEALSITKRYVISSPLCCRKSTGIVLAIVVPPIEEKIPTDGRIIEKRSRLYRAKSILCVFFVFFARYQKKMYFCRDVLCVFHPKTDAHDNDLEHNKDFFTENCKSFCL